MTNRNLVRFIDCLLLAATIATCAVFLHIGVTWPLLIAVGNALLLLLRIVT